MAQATERTTTSRRAILAGAAALPALAVPAAAIAADVTLLELVERYFAVSVKLEAATYRECELWPLLRDRYPQRPPELTVRFADDSASQFCTTEPEARLFTTTMPLPSSVRSA